MHSLKVRNARNGRALVTSDLATATLIFLGASAFAAGWQLKSATAGSWKRRLASTVGVVVVPRAVVPVHKAIGDIVKASFDTVHAFMVPKSAATVGTLVVGKVVRLVRRPTMNMTA